MNRAIIIGASTGIGRALARILVEQDYHVGIVARRIELLHQIREQFPEAIRIRQIDVSDPPGAILGFGELVQELGGIDLVVIASGVGHLNKRLDWQPELETIATNVIGFTAMATAAMKQFLIQGSGQLVGITSVAALRGASNAPAYNASKAYMANYLQGLRQTAFRSGLPIVVTEICPGFVATGMAKGDGVFWAAPVEKAATQIYRAIANKRPHAYITRRWRLIAWVLKLLPDALYQRL